METSGASPLPHNWLKTLAGVEVGVLGGVAMLCWFALNSVWHAQRWYAMPNLLGSTFYGDLAFRSAFGKASIAGVALHLCATGTVGGVFGLFAPRGRRLRWMTLAGVAAALICYALVSPPFWRAVNPLVLVYSSDRAMLTGYLLFGICLGRWPRALDVLEAPSSAGPAVGDPRC